LPTLVRFGDREKTVFMPGLVGEVQPEAPRLVDVLDNLHVLGSYLESDD